MKNDLNMDELKRIDPETLDRLDAVMDDLQGFNSYPAYLYR